MESKPEGLDPLITLCYGVMCSYHSTCRRYLELESADLSHVKMIATCATSADRFGIMHMPLYLPGGKTNK